MLCIIDKYRLCEFHLNTLAGQKGEFCDLVTLGLSTVFYEMALLDLLQHLPSLPIK